MADGAALYDPEVEHLIQEIAADPRSMLLRVDRSDHRVAYLSAQDRLSARRAGLTLAERHLLRVYRDEVAALLSHACIDRIAADSRSRVVLVSRTLSGRSVHPAAGARISTRDAALERLQGRSVLPVDAKRLLKSMSRPSPAVPSARELALASLRIVPSERARMCLLAAEMVHGSSGRTSALTRYIIASSVTRDSVAYAWTARGKLFAVAGHYRHAVAAYTRACALAPEWNLPRMVRLIMAAQSDDARLLSNAACALDEATPRDDVIAEYLEVLSRQRVTANWEPQLPCLAQCRDVAANTESASGRLLSALVA
jgi:hypothetical protein